MSDVVDVLAAVVDLERPLPVCPGFFVLYTAFLAAQGSVAVAPAFVNSELGVLHSIAAVFLAKAKWQHSFALCGWQVVLHRFKTLHCDIACAVFNSLTIAADGSCCESG